MSSKGEPAEASAVPSDASPSEDFAGLVDAFGVQVALEAGTHVSECFLARKHKSALLAYGARLEGQRDHLRDAWATQYERADRAEAEIERLRGELAKRDEALAQSAGDGWLPIESAPRDRTVTVDLWGTEPSDYEYRPAAMGGRRFPSSSFRQKHWGADFDADWLSQDGRPVSPTHWRPLPAPPGTTPIQAPTPGPVSVPEEVRAALEHYANAKNWKTGNWGGGEDLEDMDGLICVQWQTEDGYAVPFADMGDTARKALAFLAQQTPGATP